MYKSNNKVDEQELLLFCVEYYVKKTKPKLLGSWFGGNGKKQIKPNHSNYKICIVQAAKAV